MRDLLPRGIPRKPTISIVTPCFNRVWAVQACIASVRSQVGVDYEHIIVDGGSTDGTIEVLRAEAASDGRVRFVSQPDDGMYDAVNRGLRMASGDVLAYLNTDDFYLAGTFSRVADLFARSPTVSMVYGHWMSWYPATGFLELLPVNRYTSTDIATYALLPQPSVFFRRSVFEALDGFDLSYKLVADNEFFSRAVETGFVCVHLDSFFSVQTVHSGNLLAGNETAAAQSSAEIDRYRKERRAGSKNGQTGRSDPVSRVRSTLRHKLAK